MTVWAENRRAFFDYQILARLEAGIVLSGFEVKAVKAGRVDLSESYVKIGPDNKVILINAKIFPLQPENLHQDYRVDRSRELLLTKKEIKNLLGKLQERRLTFLPLRLYNKKGLIKVELGLAKSKRQFEKRELLRQKAIERELKRTLKTKGLG